MTVVCFRVPTCYSGDGTLSWEEFTKAFTVG